MSFYTLNPILSLPPPRHPQPDPLIPTATPPLTPPPHSHRHATLNPIPHSHRCATLNPIPHSHRCATLNPISSLPPQRHPQPDPLTPTATQPLTPSPHSHRRATLNPIPSLPPPPLTRPPHSHPLSQIHTFLHSFHMTKVEEN